MAMEPPRGPAPNPTDAVAKGPRGSSRSKRWGSAHATSPDALAPSEAERAQIEAVPLCSVIREAVRAELGEFAQGAFARQVVRSEMDAALQAWFVRPRRRPSKDAPASAAQQPRPVPSPRPARASIRDSLDETLDLACSNTMRLGAGLSTHSSAKREFNVYMDSMKLRTPHQYVSDSDSGSGHHQVTDWFFRKWVWLLSVEEPNRTGCLARFINSMTFEMVICIVILLNCAFMIYAANDVMLHSGVETPTVQAGEWAFQIFYSVELVLRLIVHRQFFFWRHGCQLNAIDLIVVISGFITLVTETLGWGVVGPMRALRLVKFGKAIRFVRIMSHFDKLRSFLVCLSGSFSSFFWCLVMFMLVIVLFSLFLMQIIASHIENTGGDHMDWDGLFGTFSDSALTLCMVSTGGEDWGVVFERISETGVLGVFIYLIFIAFVQFALVNIITGIFVEAAMATLSPNAEARAIEHDRREKACAEELKSLCLQVDTDFSGKLSREQFEDGLRRKRIPRLLTLLQLQTHNVIEFFDTMADDDGQVDIETFVHGCMQLKGPATNFDLQMFVAEFRAASAHQDTVLQMQDRTLELLREEVCVDAGCSMGDTTLEGA